MTPDEVRQWVLEIQARAEKATLGPWYLLSEYAGIGSLVDSVIRWSGIAGWKRGNGKANGEFIAAARSDIPWLCEQLLSLIHNSRGEDN